MSELSDRLTILQRKCYAECYKQSLIALADQPGITINHETIQRYDATINAMATPVGTTWPTIGVVAKPANLLTYTGIPLLPWMIGPESMSFLFPNVEYYVAPTWSRYFRRKRIQYAGYGGEQPGDWRLTYDERDLLKANKEPTIETIKQDHGLGFYQRASQQSCMWMIDRETPEAFVEKLARTAKFHNLSVRKGAKTVANMRAELFAKYVKEVWTPMKAWWLALPEAKRNALAAHY